MGVLDANINYALVMMTSLLYFRRLCRVSSNEVQGGPLPLTLHPSKIRRPPPAVFFDIDRNIINHQRDFFATAGYGGIDSIWIICCVDRIQYDICEKNELTRYSSRYYPQPYICWINT